ncbi:MAG: hypothetical protein AB7G06_05860 [Bdellovibrionales bacterium]
MSVTDLPSPHNLYSTDPQAVARALVAEIRNHRRSAGKKPLSQPTTAVSTMFRARYHLLACLAGLNGRCKGYMAPADIQLFDKEMAKGGEEYLFRPDDIKKLNEALKTEDIRLRPDFVCPHHLVVKDLAYRQALTLPHVL